MGKCEYTTSSTASGRLVTAVTKEGVRVLNPKKSGGELTFTVHAKSIARVDDTLKGFERVYEKKERLNVFRRFFPKRIGILIGIVVSVICSIVLSNFVFSIDVSGVGEADRIEIIEYLENVGIREGANKGGIDCERIERSLMEKFSLSVVDCKIEGLTLSVSVKEELPPPDYVGMLDVVPVVASEDAVVTRIVTVSGTVKTVRGKSVKKGEILIDNYHTIGDMTVECRAIGEVYGKVWRKVEVFVPNTVIALERTGVSKEVSFISFKAPSSDTGAPFTYFEKDVKSIPISNFLPFWKNTVTFYECKAVETKNPRLDDIESVVDGVRNELRLAVIDEGEYLDDWYTVREISDGVTVSVVCELERRIDTYIRK